MKVLRDLINWQQICYRNRRFCRNPEIDIPVIIISVLIGNARLCQIIQLQPLIDYSFIGRPRTVNNFNWLGLNANHPPTTVDDVIYPRSQIKKSCLIIGRRKQEAAVAPEYRG